MSHGVNQSLASRIVTIAVVAGLVGVGVSSAFVVREAHSTARASVARELDARAASARSELTAILREAARALETGSYRFEGFRSVSRRGPDGRLIPVLGTPLDSARPLAIREGWRVEGTVVAWRRAHERGVGVEARGPSGELLVAALVPDGELGTGVALARPGPGAGEGFEVVRSEDGTFVARHQLPFAGDIALRVEAPFSAAFASVSTLLARAVAVDLLLLGAIGLFAYRFARRVSGALQDLTEETRSLARGEADAAPREQPVAGEVRTLSLSVRDMAAALRAERDELRLANERLLSKNEELQAANEILEQLSITDGLTKLHNHRFFQEQLTREIKRVGRTGEPLTILICDIDDFKALNDRLGHKAGDDLLLGLARMLSESVRESDFLARYGGEEFVVLAAQTQLEGGVLLAEKIRTQVESASFILDQGMRPTHVTISVGVAEYRGDRAGFFRAADQALYRAKAAGKNCVVAEGE